MQQKGIFYQKKGGKKFNRYSLSEINAFVVEYIEVR